MSMYQARLHNEYNARITGRLSHVPDLCIDEKAVWM